MISAPAAAFATRDGKPSHAVIERALLGLVAICHFVELRGGGEAAGALVQGLPQAAEDPGELRVVQGLEEVVEGPEPEGPPGVLEFRVAREEDREGPLVRSQVGGYALEEPEAVEAGHVRHTRDVVAQHRMTQVLHGHGGGGHQWPIIPHHP